jgi:hypothetical protein
MGRDRLGAVPIRRHATPHPLSGRAAGVMRRSRAERPGGRAWAGQRARGGRDRLRAATPPPGPRHAAPAPPAGHAAGALRRNRTGRGGRARPPRHGKPGGRAEAGRQARARGGWDRLRAVRAAVAAAPPILLRRPAPPHPPAGRGSS